jgi:hypothetical protein
MAGIGPAPNPASGRSAYRAKKGVGAVLTRDVTVETPRLPDAREWHPLTVEWWQDVWDSPMAQQYDESDKHGLFAMAMVVDDFWMAETPRQRQEASQEIRLQGVRFGLSPIDRLRLRWEVEKADEAQARGQKRRRAAEEKSSPVPGTVADPRAALRAL